MIKLKPIVTSNKQFALYKITAFPIVLNLKHFYDDEKL